MQLFVIVVNFRDTLNSNPDDPTPPDPSTNPYPGIQIPSEHYYTNENTDIILNPNHSNPPIYPDDYQATNTIRYLDNSDQYITTIVYNRVRTTDTWNDNENEFTITDLGNNYIGVRSVCPENPKLYANKIYKEINLTQYLQQKSSP